MDFSIGELSELERMAYVNAAPEHKWIAALLDAAYTIDALEDRVTELADRVADLEAGL